MDAKKVKTALLRVASVEKADILSGFFRTGKGEYGEGDRFLGVVVPEQRKIARKFFSERGSHSSQSTMAVVRELLRSTYHEERFTALLILVEQYKRSPDEDRQRLYDFYLEHLDRVNNWDLVDVSAPHIVGAHLLDKNPSILFTLAESDNLWRRRVAVLATFAFITAGRFEETLSLAERLLVENKERHDLVHKAVGWMLREVGKRDQRALEAFLDRHAVRLPRTALRYAIERFDEAARRNYLAAGKYSRRSGK